MNSCRIVIAYGNQLIWHDRQSRLSPLGQLLIKGLLGRGNQNLKVYLQESQKLKSFASAHSNGTLRCLGLIECSRTDRFSRESIVGSTD